MVHLVCAATALEHSATLSLSSVCCSDHPPSPAGTEHQSHGEYQPCRGKTLQELQQVDTQPAVNNITSTSALSFKPQSPSCQIEDPQPPPPATPHPQPGHTHSQLQNN